MPKNTLRYLLSILFFLLGVGLMVFTVRLSVSQLDSQPVLVKAPASAREQVVTLMDAVCASDFAAAGSYLYGAPTLQAEPEEETARALWDAYRSSLQYTVVGDCYASESGLAVDLELRALDLDSVTATLHDRCQVMLDQAVSDAEDPALIYDGGNQYRQELVLDVFRRALEQSLREDAVSRDTSLTLHLTYDYDSDRWWILPEEPLIRWLSGNL